MSETRASTPRRGFAALSPERRRELARLGGQRAQALGTAHRFTPEEAAEAGRKGGHAGLGRRGRRSEAAGEA
jgi:general stress protein YciG